MRINRLITLLSFKRLVRLKKDFSTPFKALLAASGVFAKQAELLALDNSKLIVDRSDLPVWSEYFAEKNCTINIEKGLFHIQPHDDQYPDYYIKGCTGGMTYQPARWAGEKTPKLIQELEQQEWSRFSQHGEDGVVEKLLETIGVKHKFIVEFGAHDGFNMSNSRYLITEKKWRALLIEADPTFYRQLESLYNNDSNVVLKNCFVTKENINSLFKDAGVPEDFEVLSIDVDGPDYYLWEALTEFNPKIVIVEYNSSKLPTDDYVVPEDKIFELGATKDEGASLLAFYNLGKAKGYQAIYTELYGSNLFFLHNSVIDKFNITGIDPATLYQPPQFGELAGTSAPSGRGYK